MKTDSDTPKDAAGAGSSPSSLFGFLWDFRERSVNHTSWLYGAMSAFSVLYMIEGLFPLAVWPLVKSVAFAIAAKRFQSLHALNSDPNS